MLKAERDDPRLLGRLPKCKEMTEMLNQDWRTDFKGYKAGGDFTGAWTRGNLSGSGSEGFDRLREASPGLQEGEGGYR